MPATKQTYSATAWFDTFLSGTVENRVLEVVYDATKTYGKTYYWFQINITNCYVAICSGWNATTHVPTGTQYLDFFSTTTNGPGTNCTNLLPLAWSTSRDIRLTRFTSQGDTSQSWFRWEDATNYATFAIIQPSATVRPWIDLDKVFFNGILQSSCTISGPTGWVAWGQRFLTRRSDIGFHLRDNTVFSGYHEGHIPRYFTLRYGGLGNLSNATVNKAGFETNSSPCVILPLGFTNTNPEHSADYSPIFHSMPYDLRVVEPFSVDFGVCMYYPSNTMQYGDKIIVDAGVEEWEILDRANSATVATGCSPLFVARVV